MKAIRNVLIISVLVLVLTSCNTFTAKPTETSIPTATSLPTLTSTPEPTVTPTSTAKPAKTPVPPTATPSAPVLPMPSGVPVANWEGIPVMPSALAGDDNGKSYSFTVKASPDEVQNFYEKEMGKLGWAMFATGQGTTNALMLIFMKGSATVSVSIIPQPDGLMYVMLVK
jgi:hypothetical protein